MEILCSKCGLIPPYNKYSKQCINCRKEYNYKWRKQKGVTKHEQLKQQEYYYLNREKLINYSTNYNKQNPDKIKIYRSKPSIKKSKYNRIYSLIHNTLKSKDLKKNAKTKELLGYTAKDLRDHLNKFSNIWDNMHIDHKIPVDWFDDDTPLYVINHLDNIWLVESKYNLEKQDKWCNIPDESYLSIAKQYLMGYEYKRENYHLPKK